MKKQLLTLLLAVVTLPCFAQIEFEQGYYINNSDQRSNILIKNVDWKNNPQTFEYKVSETSAIEIENIKNIKEFGVARLAKFIRATVNIDESSVNTSDLSRDKNPVFVSKTVFLRTLVEGDYTLYEYADGNMKRYFYAKGNASIEPLVYKQYLSSDVVPKIMTNNTYQQQLFNDLKCENISLKNVQSVDYNRNDLLKFFREYNTCTNKDITYIQEKPDRNKFDLTIRPRLNHSSLYVKNTLNAGFESTYDSQTSFGIGLEAEFFLPYNKNKWSVFLEPSYQSYEAEKITGNRNDYLGVVDYKSIEVPVGLRHYLYLNQDSKIFFNAAYVFSFDLGANINFTRHDGRDVNEIDIKPNGNIALGAGYKFLDKYGIEVRYQGRHVLDNYYIWNSNYKSISLILGYSFL